jgi:carbon storage regulator CsrA
MLSLNRRVGEAFSLYGELDGKRVELAIVVTQIDGKTVKMGFDAPSWMSIAREEIAEPTEALARVRDSYRRRSGPR